MKKIKEGDNYYYEKDSTKGISRLTPINALHSKDFIVKKIVSSTDELMNNVEVLDKNSLLVKECIETYRGKDRLDAVKMLCNITYNRLNLTFEDIRANVPTDDMT